MRTSRGRRVGRAEGKAECVFVIYERVIFLHLEGCIIDRVKLLYQNIVFPKVKRLEELET
jgi:hypothetical protein